MTARAAEAAAAATTSAVRALLARPVPAGTSRSGGTTGQPDPGSGRHGHVLLGHDEHGHEVGLALSAILAGRLLVQGNSGAGKSWLRRRLGEQCAISLPIVVIDPEGEFDTLAELLDWPIIHGDRLSLSAMEAAAQRCRAHRLSAVVNFAGVARTRQMMAATSFLRALVQAPREDWHAQVVAVDEAHIFAPYGDQDGAPPSVRKESITALVDLMSRGRKRGLGSVIFTQRLARLSKSVVSEVANALVGRNTLDLDIRRAAELIGWDARRAFDRLPEFQPGQFVATGPGFTSSPAIVRIGPVNSTHRGATPELAAVAPVRGENARQLLDLGELEALNDVAGDAGGREMSGFRAVRSFVREPGFAWAGRICELLAPIYPDGATVASLARSLQIEPAALATGVELLERYRVIELTGEPGPNLGVRLEREFGARKA